MFIVYAFAILLSLDTEMTQQEQKKAGLHKLSKKQKLSLQNWIDLHYAKREEPIAAAERLEENQSVIQENLLNGSYIRLSNGTLWNIHPKDVPVTQGWITPVDILVTKSGDPDYPYKLTNTLSGSSVRAKKADEVPQTTTPSTTPSHVEPQNTK